MPFRKHIAGIGQAVICERSLLLNAGSMEHIHTFSPMRSWDVGVVINGKGWSTKLLGTAIATESMGMLGETRVLGFVFVNTAEM